jgi:alpha-D-xyloside xylohydrolase
MVYYTKLRYRLLPYIYSVAGKTYFDNYTIMRGLFMDFPQDEAVASVADQYLFGPSIMVAPVYEYKARQRQVYFPRGTNWFDFYSGKKYEGGSKTAIDAPLERMPLFVREGSIVVCGPVINHTGEIQDPLTLYIFPGKDATFRLYDDEGTNYEYENGKFSTIQIGYDDANRKLSIGKREGSYPGMPEKRRFEVVFIKGDRGGVDLIAKAGQVVEYRGEALVVDLPKGD